MPLLTYITTLLRFLVPPHGLPHAGPASSAALLPLHRVRSTARALLPHYRTCRAHLRSVAAYADYLRSTTLPAAAALLLPAAVAVPVTVGGGPPPPPAAPDRLRVPRDLPPRASSCCVAGSAGPGRWALPLPARYHHAALPPRMYILYYAAVHCQRLLHWCLHTNTTTNACLCRLLPAAVLAVPLYRLLLFLLNLLNLLDTRCGWLICLFAVRLSCSTLFIFCSIFTLILPVVVVIGLFSVHYHYHCYYLFLFPIVVIVVITAFTLYSYVVDLVTLFQSFTCQILVGPGCQVYLPYFTCPTYLYPLPALLLFPALLPFYLYPLHLCLLPFCPFASPFAYRPVGVLYCPTCRLVAAPTACRDLLVNRAPCCGGVPTPHPPPPPCLFYHRAACRPCRI